MCGNYRKQPSTLNLKQGKRLKFLKLRRFEEPTTELKLRLLKKECIWLVLPSLKFRRGPQGLRTTYLRKGMHVRIGSVSIRETANQIQLLLQEKTDAARVKHCCVAQRNLKPTGSKRKEQVPSSTQPCNVLQRPPLAAESREVS